MTPFFLVIMTINTKSGMAFFPTSAEELAPYKEWITWIKKIAINCIRSYHLPMKEGHKYNAKDFWEILILHKFQEK